MCKTNIKKLWNDYNTIVNKLSQALGRTTNIVGEYAEYLTAQYYNGKLLASSHKSADVVVLQNGKQVLYQVKARKMEHLSSTQLGIIRSWEFDFLVVIIFDLNGGILKALEVPVDIAKNYAKENSHQNGWVITTTQEFLNDQNSKDITKPMS